MKPAASYPQAVDLAFSRYRPPTAAVALPQPQERRIQANLGGFNVSRKIYRPIWNIAYQ